MSFASTDLGLYIHWPFCLTKCPYCDFNSHIQKTIDHDLWANSLMTEMATMAAMLEPRPLRSIFIGGGTPSLMMPATVGQLITAAKTHFGFSDDIEITMEANPTSAEARKLADFADMGVNRLSVGVQALNDNDLAKLGREHSAGEALAVLEHAKKIFPRLSADFIYARPGQDAVAWENELAQILDLGLTHLSLYQLTLEPGTAFYSRHKRGLLHLPDEKTANHLYALTQKRTEAAMLACYEISNHAIAGEESQHNLIYWRGHDWIGIGPGATGRFWHNDARIETRTKRKPDTWLEAVASAGSGIEYKNQETSIEAAAEMLMMGLRLREGVNLELAEQRLGARHHWMNNAQIPALEANNLITINAEGTRLAATAKGMAVINSIIAALII